MRTSIPSGTKMVTDPNLTVASMVVTCCRMIACCISRWQSPSTERTARCGGTTQGPLRDSLPSTAVISSGAAAPPLAARCSGQVGGQAGQVAVGARDQRGLAALANTPPG